MIRYLILAVLVLCIVACVPMKNTSKSGKGFTTLFDGKTTQGWHLYNKSVTPTAWEVQDGVLHLNAQQKEGRGDLVTDKSYTNYHLKLEWKISQKGNSGIIFNVNEDSKYPAPYSTGPEMQILDDAGHPDGKFVKHHAGDLYDIIASNKKTVKPVGEWNLAEIILNNGKLQLYLNGNKAVETTMWDNNWANLLAQSKFKSWKGFATYKTGKIALQDHGDDVWFRNIRIKEL